MESRSNVANEIENIDVAVQAATPFVLSPQHQMWIDYNALSGIVTDMTEDQTIRKVPIHEFAGMVGVDRETLRRWRTQIPDFWDRVNKRREELAPQSRVQAFHEKWYVSALKMNNWAVSEAWARNFVPGYKEAKTKVEHELGNSWTALAQGKKEVIEGEIIDESKTS